MIRKLIASLFLLSTLLWSQTAYFMGDRAVSLNAVAATGAGTVFSMPASGSGIPSKFTWTNFVSATATALTVNLEGSNDNFATAAIQLDQSTSTTTEARHVVNKPVKFVRCNIAVYTTNGTTETCSFVASQ